MILIGDAAHAMLPTQGQGASQTIEDAEALGAYFEDIVEKPSAEEIQSAMQEVVASRYARASLVQKYSRDAAKPATDKGGREVKMRPDEFMDYNCKQDLLVLIGEDVADIVRYRPVPWRTSVARAACFSLTSRHIT